MAQRAPAARAVDPFHPNSTLSIEQSVELSRIRFFGARVFGGGASAGLWVTGIAGFLILAGGALLTDDVNTPMKVIDRAGQISIASFYVVFVYRVIDRVESLFRRQQTQAVSGSSPDGA